MFESHLSSRLTDLDLCVGEGDPNGVVKACSEVLGSGGLDPDQAALIHLERGEALAAVGLHEPAAADFDAALELEPDFGAAFHARAALRLTLGELDAALEDVEAAVKISTQADHLELRSRIHLALGNWDRALFNAEGALNFGFEGAEPHFTAAQALLQLDRTDEALERIGQAMAMEPDRTDFVATRDAIRESLGDGALMGDTAIGAGEVALTEGEPDTCAAGTDC